MLEAHQDVEFPDHETRVRLFWFYAGALAAGDHGCETEEDFSHFILGANTRCPQPPRRMVHSSGGDEHDEAATCEDDGCYPVEEA